MHHIFLYNCFVIYAVRVQLSNRYVNGNITLLLKNAKKSFQKSTKLFETHFFIEREIYILLA